MTNLIYFTGFGVLVAGLAGGCAAAVEEGEAGEAPSTTSQAASGAGAGKYLWASGMGPVQMSPLANSICFLSEIKGRFRSDNDRVAIVANGNNWQLTGSSSSNNTNPQATARCINSTTWSLQYTWSAGQTRTDLGGSTNRACFLVDVHGKFDSDTDTVQTRLDGGHWYLEGGTDTGGAAARCVSNITYETKESVTEGQVTEIQIFDANGDRWYNDSEFTPHACFLTTVGGNWYGMTFPPFLGGGSYGGANIVVHDYDVNGSGRLWTWTVASVSDAPSGGSTAVARCIR